MPEISRPIALAHAQGVIPYVARPERGPAIDQGYFGKDAFPYDAAQDCYTCPARQRLNPFSRSEKGGPFTIRYGHPQSCRDCTLKPQCTPGTARTIKVRF